MKSGVAFWTALRSVKEIHPCWSHLNGTPLVEADLPRPIITEYKSIFDLPSARTPQQQVEALATADALPRVTLVTAAAVSRQDVQQTVELNAASFAADAAEAEAAAA